MRTSTTPKRNCSSAHLDGTCTEVTIDLGLPHITVGSAPALSVSRPAQRSLGLQPADLPSRLYATLYTGSSGGFVASTAGPTATGWSDPVPGRVFLLAVDQRLFTAHCNGLIAAVDSCPSQGDTWMLPVGESCHARWGNPPSPRGQLHQRLVNNTCQFTSKDTQMT